MLHSHGVRTHETINESLEKVIGRVDGLFGIIISDIQGTVYSRVMRQDSPQHLPLFPVRFAVPDPSNPKETVHVPATDPGSVVFSNAVSTGNRLGLGQLRCITCMYNDHMLIQYHMSPLIITFVAALGANRALIYNMLPELRLKLEKIRADIENSIRLSDIDYDDH